MFTVLKESNVKVLWTLKLADSQVQIRSSVQHQTDLLSWFRAWKSYRSWGPHWSTSDWTYWMRYHCSLIFTVLSAPMAAHNKNRPLVNVTLSECAFNHYNPKMANTWLMKVKKMKKQVINQHNHHFCRQWVTLLAVNINLYRTVSQVG